MQSNFSAYDWHKNQGTYLLNQALRSSTILAGSVLATLFMGLLWGMILGSETPRPLKILFMLPVPGLMGYSALKLKDTEDDWATWAMHNQPQRRIEAIDRTHQASLASIRSYQIQAQPQPQPLINPALEKAALQAHKSELKVWEQAQLLALRARAKDGAPAIAPDEPDSGNYPVCWEPYDPARLLGQDPMSSLIAGVPSSGKGMVVSNALRNLIRRHPKIRVTVLDPKADPKETGYWDVEGNVTTHRFEGLTRSPEDLRDWILDELESYLHSQYSPRLLILDELSMVMATLGTIKPATESGIPQIKTVLAKLVSAGDSHGAWLWAMGQSIGVADLGLTGGFRSMLRPIGLVSPRNRQAVQSFLRTDFVQTIPIDMVNQLCAASPVDRAVFCGATATWYPLAQLENHSGFSRDSRFDQPEPEPVWVEPEEDRPSGDLRLARKLLAWLEANPRSRRKALQSSWLRDRNINATRLDELIESLPDIAEAFDETL